MMEYWGGVLVKGKERCNFQGKLLKNFTFIWIRFKSKSEL
jgi:hypothetical protein